MNIASVRTDTDTYNNKADDCQVNTATFNLCQDDSPYGNLYEITRYDFIYF